MIWGLLSGWGWRAAGVIAVVVAVLAFRVRSIDQTLRVCVAERTTQQTVIGQLRADNQLQMAAVDDLKAANVSWTRAAEASRKAALVAAAKAEQWRNDFLELQREMDTAPACVEWEAADLAAICPVRYKQLRALQ